MLWFRSGYSNVNVSQSNYTNNEEDVNRDDARLPKLLPLSRVKIDTERSIGNVRRRVSTLVGGAVDRAGLAKSILASRSLLDRNDDIGRLLDGLRAPFTTSLDDGFRGTENRDRNVTGTITFTILQSNVTRSHSLK